MTLKQQTVKNDEKNDANILPSSGQENKIAQPKTDKLSDLASHLIFHRYMRLDLPELVTPLKGHSFLLCHSCPQTLSAPSGQRFGY